MMTRRHALKTTAVASLAAAALPGTIAQTAATTAARATGPFNLPPLPYAVDALEPHIDARTMEIHHSKHHAAYVTNLNKALSELPDLAKKSIEDIMKSPDAPPAVINNGGGHYNHSLFWQMMKQNGGGEPSGELAKAIEVSFKSFVNFKALFSEGALKQFGSGWAWLTLDQGKLGMETSGNQFNPLVSGKQVLLGLDVWEHAYYLKYQNKRADYITAWWNVVNWDFVAERYAKLKA